MYKTSVRGVLIKGNKTYGQVTKDVLGPFEAKAPPIWWYAGIFLSVAMAVFGVWGMYTTISQGIGTWNVNNSVGWGLEIISFVWWIGIGHAGTAFSIFLLILRQKWRTSINRSQPKETGEALSNIC